LITTYQIRNVLRTYGNQLRKKTLSIQDSATPVRQFPDSVNISDKARRKQMLNQISNQLISQIDQKDYRQKAKQDIQTGNPPINPNEERNIYEY
jgi:hypothetical protein